MSLWIRLCNHTYIHTTSGDDSGADTFLRRGLWGGGGWMLRLETCSGGAAWEGGRA